MGIESADLDFGALDTTQQLTALRDQQEAAASAGGEFLQHVDIQLAQANTATTAPVGPGNAASITAVPASPADAPKQLNLTTLEPQFAAQNQATLNDGNEHGGTLTVSRDGNLHMINEGGGTQTGFNPDYNVPSGQTMVGVFHTHPVKTPNPTGGNSLSGGDAGEMINTNMNIIVAESRGEQFAFLRTAQTPASVDKVQLDRAMDTRVSMLSMGQGMSVSDATKTAASELAQRYGLAYYEGQNGILTLTERKGPNAEFFKWDRIR